MLLWLYFFLLIFEGAFRKWFLPSFSTPLLVIRDPIALLALFRGAPFIPRNIFYLWILPLIFIGYTAILLALSFGHGDIFTAVYGARIVIIQFPLIFLFPAVFNQRDVLVFAKVLLLISIPMTLLVSLQSILPNSHVLNVAPGGEGTASFQGALDRFRPPGTFSFITGVSSFYTLVTSSLLAKIYSKQQNSAADYLLIVLSAMALLVAIPVSISRTLLISVVFVFCFLVLSFIISRSSLIPLVSGLVLLSLILSLSSLLPIVQETSQAFAARWSSANQTEGGERGISGVLDRRVVSVITETIFGADGAPLLGYGIGLGTNVGAQRLTGAVGFALSENPWQALVAEMGLPLGFAFLLWRVSLSMKLIHRSVIEAVAGNRIPFIFLGTSFPNVLIGLTAQPTSLGFIVLSAGLTLASFKRCNN